MVKHLALYIALQLFTSLYGCGPDKAKEPSKPTTVTEQLQVEYKERRDEYIRDTRRNSGWPSVTDCDALLWGSLAQFAVGHAQFAVGLGKVDLSLAEYYPGEWHRRPVPSCWTDEGGDNGSKSTISNDMLLGVLVAAWETRDLQLVLRLAKFGEDESWIMGKPFPEMASRVVLKPNQIGLLGKIIEKLTDGRDKRSYAKLPAAYFQVAKDYERHIQTWGIYLHGELDDVVSRHKALHERQSNFLLATDIHDSHQRYYTASILQDSYPLLVANTDIKASMYDRLKANHEADPDDAFIGAVYGIYAGDLETPAKQLLGNYKCPSYVRAKTKEDTKRYCQVHWLAAAKVILKHAGEL